MEAKQDEEKQQALQSKYYELQMIQEQLKELQQQAKVLEEQGQDFKLSMMGLEDIEKTPPGRSILVPLTNGIFIKAEVKDTKSLIVNVGENVLVNKSVQSTKEMVQERIDTVAEYQSQTTDSLRELTMRAKAIEAELKQIVALMQK